MLGDPTWREKGSSERAIGKGKGVPQGEES